MTDRCPALAEFDQRGVILCAEPFQLAQLAGKDAVKMQVSIRAFFGCMVKLPLNLASQWIAG